MNQMLASGSAPLESLPVVANVEAEQALLGGLLFDNTAFEQVEEVLVASHFSIPLHQRMYTAFRALRDSQQLANVITLKSFLGLDPDLRQAGGDQYLAQLIASIVDLGQIRSYAELIRDLALRRELISLSRRIQEEAADPRPDYPAPAIMEEAEKTLYNLAVHGQTERQAVMLVHAIHRAIETTQLAFERGSEVTGVTTGFIDLDRKLGGLHPSDLVILAGRPSMGKTALATNMALNAARAAAQSGRTEGAPVLFFSLEMSSDQLGARILSDLAEVASDRMRRGEVEAEDFSRFVQAAKEIHNVPLFIDDGSNLSIGALRTRARRMKRQHDIGMIVIDYLQLMSGSGGRSQENRVLEISEITRGLKMIAKELEVPVLALSQLSRKVEERDDKRPLLSDLRESGSIEQDADVVMFVYRDEYYLQRSEPKRSVDDSEEKFQERYARWKERLEETHNVAEVIIAKQRHGPIGTVPLFFDGTFTRFGNLKRDYQGRLE